MPNARSPIPGIKAPKAYDFLLLKTKGVLGPGTFDKTTVALLTIHIITSYPIRAGNHATIWVNVSVP